MLYPDVGVFVEYQLRGNYFDGQYHPIPKTKSVATYERFSPANTQHKLSEIEIDYDHVDGIIQSATKGFNTWKRLSFDERANYLRRFQEVVLGRKEQIARAIALEVGKPYWESLTEASALSSKVDVTLGDSLKRIQHQQFDDILPGTRGEIYHRPLGPTLIIGPFNFPCHLANGQILSALIAGNSIIFKPSEKTPYSAQLLIDCLGEAKFPEGVINLIQGDGQIAARLIEEKSVKSIHFTGSKMWARGS